MKIPCPAYFLEPARSQGIPAVTVRPCRVLTLFPSSQQAIIELHSLQVSGRCTKFVSYADLASTAAAALEEIAARITHLPALEAKAAATAEVAGAGSGAGANSP